MTQERLLKLLDNPELLSTISYEELKTAALSYPYAHNLRYLLALKARQDDHPDADRTLVTAAVYSLDRKQLFLLMAPKQLAPQPVGILMEEAVLELKPIAAVQRELQALAPQTRTEEPVPDNRTLKETTIPAPTVPKPAGEVPPPVVSEEKTAEPEMPEPQKMPFAQPFAVWIGNFNPPVLDSSAAIQPEKTLPGNDIPATPALSAHDLAERSVAENRDVISETLARLLAKQGYRDKAVNMYERLCLAFPDKSAYFAAEIEKLKK